MQTVIRIRILITNDTLLLQRILRPIHILHDRYVLGIALFFGFSFPGYSHGHLLLFLLATGSLAVLFSGLFGAAHGAHGFGVDRLVVSSSSGGVDN